MHTLDADMHAGKSLIHMKLKKALKNSVPSEWREAQEESCCDCVYMENSECIKPVLYRLVEWSPSPEEDDADWLGSDQVTSDQVMKIRYAYDT